QSAPSHLSSLFCPPLGSPNSGSGKSKRWPSSARKGWPGDSSWPIMLVLCPFVIPLRRPPRAQRTHIRRNGKVLPGVHRPSELRPSLRLGANQNSEPSPYFDHGLTSGENLSLPITSFRFKSLILSGHAANVST